MGIKRLLFKSLFLSLLNSFKIKRWFWI